MPIINTVIQGSGGGGGGPDAYIPLEINSGVISRPTAASYTYKVPDSVTEIAQGTFYNAFGNSGLGINQNFTEFDFNNVEIVGVGGCYDMCYGAANLTTVKAPKVKELGTNAFYRGFAGTGIVSISFPALETVASSAFGTGSTSYAFRNCTALLEIHFPAAMQATIEAMSGYSAKWGATNATVYFDL